MNYQGQIATFKWPGKGVQGLRWIITKRAVRFPYALPLLQITQLRAGYFLARSLFVRHLRAFDWNPDWNCQRASIGRLICAPAVQGVCTAKLLVTQM